MDESGIEITELTKPYWDSLAGGKLSFQTCRACAHKWLPARDTCPNCLALDDYDWTPASGRGHVVSWVVYHTAFDPAFKARVPYNVAIVELAEGPRLITNLATPNETIKVGLAVDLAPEPRFNVTLPCFKPAS